MGTKQSCSVELLKAFKTDGKNIKKGTMRDILEHLDELKNSSATEAEFEANSMKALHDFKKGASEIRVQKVENEIKIRAISKALEDPVVRNFATKHPEVYLQNLLARTEVSYKGAANSVELEAGTIRAKLLSMINQEFEAEDWKLFGKGTHEKDLYRMTYDNATDVHPKAKEHYDILSKVQNEAHRHRRLSGSLTKQLKKWLTKQTHSATKLGDVGKAKWVEVVHTLTTKKPMKQEALEAIYDDIILGKYEKSLQADIMKEGATSGQIGGGNSRIIEFDNGTAAFEYNQQFGDGNLFDGVLANIDASARESAVFNKLGTNPIEAFNRITAEVVGIAKDEGETLIDELVSKGGNEAKLRKNLSKKLDRLQNSKSNLTDLLDLQVFGQKHGHSTKAKFFSAARTFFGTSKLGKVILSGGVTDVATSAAALSSVTGKTKLDMLSGIVSENVKNLSPERLKKFGKVMGVYFGSASGGVQAKLASGDKSAAWVTALADSFYKWSGLTKQTEMFQTSNMILTGIDFAEDASKSFKNLTPHKQAELDRFNINEYDWEQLGKGVGSVDGVEILAVEFLEGKGIKSPTVGLSDEKYLRDLSVKWGSIGREVSLGGSPTGGAREDVMFGAAVDPDTYRGQMLRMMGQFKKVAFASQSVVKRSALSGENAVGKTYSEAITTKGVRGTVLANTAATVSLMTAFGYMTESALALEKGITPPDPTNPETWLASMLRGGSAGVMGDFLGGEYNKRYKNLASDILGPTVGTASDVAEVFAGAMRGDEVAGKAAKKLLNNVPFGNMIVLRTAMDALILNDLQGSDTMRRKQKALEEKGQAYLLGD